MEKRTFEQHYANMLPWCIPNMTRHQHGGRGGNEECHYPQYTRKPPRDRQLEQGLLGDRFPFLSSPPPFQEENQENDFFIT